MIGNNSKIRIKITQDARLQLAQDGYDPNMGARPLKRLFEHEIKKPLSKKILFENLKDCWVEIGYTDKDYMLSIV